MSASSLAFATPKPARTESERWEEWDRFVEASPDSGFMQTSWWAEFRSMCGYGCFGVKIREQGAIVGGAVVMKRSFDGRHAFYLVCDGPLLPSDPEPAGEVFSAILSVIEKHRASEPKTVAHLRIEPRWQKLPPFVNAFRALPRGGDRYAEPRDTLWIDLRPSIDEILRQMKPKGRYNVRVAERHGVRVREDMTPAGLEDFLRIHAQTYARHGIAGYSQSYFRTLLSMLRVRRQLSIFFAEHEGKRLATALVIFFGRRATYFFGGSLAEERHVMAPYALHFEIMRRAQERGCEWYDLWGVDPIATSRGFWDGISTFKRKLGGVEVSLPPTLDLVFDSSGYDSFLRTAHG